MPATTGQGLPYPVGTDRVADGDNAIQALAQWLDNSLCFGAVTIPANTGPGNNGTMWFTSEVIALTGGCVSGGTFPKTGITVPRKGWYQLHAIANMQADAANAVARVFIGDGTNIWVQGYQQFPLLAQYQGASCMTVRQLAANTTVYWGMSSSGGTGSAGAYSTATMSTLLVRLLLPLP